MQNRLSVASHEITLFTGISTRYLFENSTLSAMFLFKILVFVSINWFWFFKILLDSVKITTLMHFPHWSLQTPSLHPPEKIRKPIVLYIFTGSQKKNTEENVFSLKVSKFSLHHQLLRHWRRLIQIDNCHSEERPVF